MAHTYDIGDVVRCTATFTNAAGAGVDPTTVVFTYLDPSGNQVSYEYGVDPEVIRPEDGAYYVDVPVNLSSTWCLRWVGTGLNAAAGEAFFIVRPSKFT